VDREAKVSRVQSLCLGSGARLVFDRRPGIAAVRVALSPPPGPPGWAHLLEHLWFGRAAEAAAGFGVEIEAAGGEARAETGGDTIALEALAPVTAAPRLLHAFARALAGLPHAVPPIAREWDLLRLEGPAAARAERRALQAVLGPAAAAALAPPPARAPDPTAFAHYVARCVRGPAIRVAFAGAPDAATVRAACAPLADLPAAASPSGAPPPGARAGRSRLAGAGPLGRVLWLMPAPGPADPDYWAALAADHVLGGGLSSRLYRALRSETGWCYALASRRETRDGSALWWIDAHPRADRVTACAARIEREIAALAEAGPGADEVELARAYLHARLHLENAHPAARARRMESELRALGAVRTDARHRAGIDAISADRVRAVVAAARDCRYEVIEDPFMASSPGRRRSL